MKKFRAKIALILVLSLILAVAIPALAATGAPTTKITGKYQDLTIEVVIPTTGTAVINPTGMPVTILSDNKKNEIGTMGQGQKVLTNPLVGYNASKFNLNIGATVAGTPTGELTLATDPTKTPTTKESVIWFEVKKNDYDIGTDTWYDADKAKAKAETVCGLNGEAVVGALNAWRTGDYDTSSDANILLTATADAKGKLQGVSHSKDAMIKEVKAGVLPEGAKAYVPTADSIFFARLSGKVALKPAKSDTDDTVVPWTTKDGLTAVITWTFEPAASELH